MERVTIKRIAYETGFSVATVSRVLSGSDYPVSTEKREAIEQCAQSLGYVPDMVARALRSKVNNEVAVVIPSFRNPFYTTALTGIENVISKKGFSMLVYMRKRQSGDARKLISSIGSKRVSGVIIATDCIDMEFAKRLLELQRDGIPVIILDDAVEGFDSLRGVFFDYRQGAKMAAEYLFSNSHRKVALISKKFDRRTRRSILEGFSSAFAAMGEPLGTDDIYESAEEDDFLAGIELANAVLRSDKRYTAIAANNDAVAMGALSAMLQGSVRVPDDISIIGMDDNIFSRITTPLLTTVRIPSEQMGALAAQYLLQTIDGTPMRCSIYMQPAIVERDTVSKI